MLLQQERARVEIAVDFFRGRRRGVVTAAAIDRSPDGRTPLGREPATGWFPFIQVRLLHR